MKLLCCICMFLISNALFAQQRHCMQVNGVDFCFIKIEGGAFSMGRDKMDENNSAHTVRVSDFWILETELTQRMWLAIMDENPSRHQGDLNLPIEYVNWQETQVFIQKLNGKTGQKFRLPSEAEWEFAARGASAKQKYAGGNSLKKLAWFEINSGDSTHLVKQKKPNAFGLYDMCGNVAEWCSDSYLSDYYLDSPVENPQGPLNGKGRVHRGGAYDFDSYRSTVFYRMFSGEEFRSSSLGFRLVLER